MGIETGLLLAGGSLLGGAIAAKGAQSAANTQADAANAATQLQRDQWNQQQANQAPWLAAGTNALAQLSSGNVMMNDPGYAFRLSEGMKGLDRTAAARGGLLSGSTLKGAMQYNSGMASQEYGNAWNRQAGLAGIGQTATNQLGQAGQSYANNAGSYGMQGAQAQGAGYMGVGNSINNAIGAGIGSYQNSNLLAMLRGNSAGGYNGQSLSSNPAWSQDMYTYTGGN